METWLQLKTVRPALLYLTAGVLRCCGLHTHDVVNPLGVVGDDGVNARLFKLTALLSSVGRDAHRNAVVEQRTSRVTLKNEKKTSNRKLVIKPDKEQW